MLEETLELTLSNMVVVAATDDPHPSNSSNDRSGGGGEVMTLVVKVGPGEDKLLLLKRSGVGSSHWGEEVGGGQVCVACGIAARGKSSTATAGTKVSD